MSAALKVASAHPSLPGHFPGNPVAPGVVVITYVLDECRRLFPDREVLGVKKLKFLHVLAPDVEFEVEFMEPRDTSLRFKAWHVGVPRVEPLLDGHLLLRALST